MATAGGGGWVRVLLRATLIGAVLQLLMVIYGHYNAGVVRWFAALGMALALLAGFIFGRFSGLAGRVGATAGGAVAGAVCAAVAVVEAFSLGDVPAWVLGFAPASSAVTGALGGLLGRLARPKR